MSVCTSDDISTSKNSRRLLCTYIRDTRYSFVEGDDLGLSSGLRDELPMLGKGNGAVDACVDRQRLVWLAVSIDVPGAMSFLVVRKMPKRVEGLKALKVAIFAEHSGKPRLSMRLR